MTLSELEHKFALINGNFSSSVIDYLESCHCDDDTKNTIEAVTREAHYALCETQNAILKYLKEN